MVHNIKHLGIAIKKGTCLYTYQPACGGLKRHPRKAANALPHRFSRLLKAEKRGGGAGWPVMRHLWSGSPKKGFQMEQPETVP